MAEITNPIEKGKYVSKISTGFGIGEDFVLQSLENAKAKNILEQKEAEKRAQINNLKIDIFSKDTIIEKTKKNILKRLTAIYYWQKNLTKSKPVINPEDVLDIIRKNTSDDVFEKIISLENNPDYIQSLIFEVEMMYNEKEENALSFDVKEMSERLHKKFLEEKISSLHKKLDLAKDSERKEILKKIQDLNKEKNGT